VLLLSFLLFILLSGSNAAKPEKDIVQRVRAPHRNLENTVIDGTGREATLHDSQNSFQGFDERKVGKSRVSVYTVAWLTLAMAAATGLGAVPFFFLELEPQWAGVCNGFAARIMLAASFDLVQGQTYWVVFGIIGGAIFIWLCRQVWKFAFVSCFSLECFFCFNKEEITYNFFFTLTKVISI